MWYAVGVAMRNFCFSLGILRSKPLPVPTVGVGNLAVGGSGKTPHADYLLALLGRSGRVAMLSRGYRRTSSGFQIDDGRHDPLLLGDEPAMVAARHPEATVAVCADRAEGVARLMALPNPPQAVVLDDVYQHRRVRPTVNVLLTEYDRPYFRDCIMPYGRLREFRSGRRRADMVVVTKCPPGLTAGQRAEYARHLGLRKGQQVFFSYLEYGPLQTMDGRPAQVDMQAVRHIVCVTGIAHPQPLVDELQRWAPVRHLRYGDHHPFSQTDMAKIRAAYEAVAGEGGIVVTTAKDAVRLRPLADCVLVAPIRVAFFADGGTSFDEAVTQRLYHS